MNKNFDGTARFSDQFQKTIIDHVDNTEFYPQAAAAGILAAFVEGEDLDGFVDCLIQDGLTKVGLANLAAAAINALQEVFRNE